MPLDIGRRRIISDNGNVAAQAFTAVSAAISGALSAVTGAFTGAVSITSTSANALAVGRQGTTSPALKVDASASSSATGLAITAAASGSGVALAALGGTNESLTLAAKGTGSVTVNPGVAIPAGGSAGAALLATATAAFGVYFGSGAPSVVAAKGSLYLRSDGSSGSTRLYVASDSAGTWVAVTTAS